MIRSKLRNKFPKSRSACHKRAYNKQRNNCVSFLRKKKTNKKAYSSKFKVENQKFWKTVQSFFSDKSKDFETVSLIEVGKLPTDNCVIADTFFFKT